MRTIHSNHFIGKLLLLTVVIASVAFVAPRGGDVFKIYINNKMVVEQAVHGNPKMKVITLDQRNYNDEVSVYYSHCGQIGKSRQLSIRDASDKVIKTWKYADTEVEHMAMTFRVKDILDLQKGETSDKFTIVYTSKELPKGYSLAGVVASKSNKTIGTP